MRKKFFPSDVIEQGREVLVGWTQIGPGVEFGTLTSTFFASEVNSYVPLEEEITALENQLAEKRNQRETLCLSVWDKVKRVRASVRGIYGDDSMEYEFVGGKRMSERKLQARKIAAA